MVGKDSLEERVIKFLALELPGQQPFMHMGTGYLVSDLWREVVRLKEIVATIKPKENHKGECTCKYPNIGLPGCQKCNPSTLTPVSER